MRRRFSDGTVGHLCAANLIGKGCFAACSHLSSPRALRYPAAAFWGDQAYCPTLEALVAAYTAAEEVLDLHRAAAVCAGPGDATAAWQHDYALRW